MSLCLYFLPIGLNDAAARDRQLTLTEAMRTAHSRIVDELMQAHPEIELQGTIDRGSLLGHPRGELLLEPGCISCSLRGVVDEAPVRAMVDWFLARGWYCEDPQDAGFGNRAKVPGEPPSSLRDYDELIGSRLISIRLEREFGSGLALEWLLADGRKALVRFATFNTGRLPDLGFLLDSAVTAVLVDETRNGVWGKDLDIHLQDGNGKEQVFSLGGAIYRSAKLTSARD